MGCAPSQEIDSSAVAAAPPRSPLPLLPLRSATSGSSQHDERGNTDHITTGGTGAGAEITAQERISSPLQPPIQLGPEDSISVSGANSLPGVLAVTAYHSSHASKCLNTLKPNSSISNADMSSRKSPAPSFLSFGPVATQRHREESTRREDDENVLEAEGEGGAPIRLICPAPSNVFSTSSGSKASRFTKRMSVGASYTNSEKSSTQVTTTGRDPSLFQSQFESWEDAQHGQHLEDYERTLQLVESLH